MVTNIAQNLGKPGNRLIPCDLRFDKNILPTELSTGFVNKYRNARRRLALGCAGCLLQRETPHVTA
jgi:hypothetical protein